ncbi:MAG: halocarboxylic acid dehydrogenase DehI family protein [Planctomycetia bacterium]|nr:halocarboxylic acid dehydrogenase DehI family protein [Planctomycetia bacterium]
MFGLGKPTPVAEHEADGEVERVYHEIKQVLRVTGVNLNFRDWAGYKKFFPVMWDALRPNAETRDFETAADCLRIEAANAAHALGPLQGANAIRLGESQAFQIRAALRLYRYINPKLLVFTSAVRLALAGESTGSGDAKRPVKLVELGAPHQMYALEMESEKPHEDNLNKLYTDIKRTLSLKSINSDYRTLALWPNYLAGAWHKLKPVIQQDHYAQASIQLLELARAAARALPLSISLSRDRIQELGEDTDEIVTMTDHFESLLPNLILNIALLEHDFQAGEDLASSPFPAPDRHVHKGGAV